jgi:hypothetical protein
MFRFVVALQVVDTLACCVTPRPETQESAIMLPWIMTGRFSTRGRGSLKSREPRCQIDVNLQSHSPVSIDSQNGDLDVKYILLRFWYGIGEK